MDFDCLVLLVGTNPLPNLIVANYFLKENPNLKSILLFYSKKDETINQNSTFEITENLRKTLAKQIRSLNLEKQIDIFCSSISNVSSGNKILSDFRRDAAIQIMQKQSYSFHLNYTGGTKILAIFSYLFFKQNWTNTTFSYLDARSHRIIFDDETKTTDLRTTIHIDLDDTLTLHGFEQINKSKEIESKNNESVFRNTVDILSQWIEEDKINLFLNWKIQILRKRFYLGRNIVTSWDQFLQNATGQDNQDLSDKLATTKLILFESETVQEILSSLPDDYKIIDNEALLIDQTKPSNFKIAVKFLDGSWLEQYVKSIIEKNIQKAERKNIQVRSNWEIVPKGCNRNFELDVFLNNGYQFCGISCTTSSEMALCKEKGFELLHRNKQIGGDETKGILVTCLKDDQRRQVREDFRLLLGTSYPKIKILGVNDLKQERLWNEVEGYFFDNYVKE